jgi:hypothetical protein
MRVIDIDPDLLERSAAAELHAAEQGAIHMDGEIACLDASGVPKLLETLTPTGPWAWAIMPERNDDGTVQIPIATTLEEIAACYRQTRGYSNMLGFEPLIEVRGAWYTFQEGVSRSYVPSLDRYGEHETIALFPVTSSSGITGELAWWRMVNSGNELPNRRAALTRHDRFVQAMRDGDLDALDDVYDDGMRAAIRDYVADTGTLVSLEGAAAQRGYYEQLFDRYAVLQVDLLERIVQEWYVFAELRFTVQDRHGADAGRQRAFHTAEFLVPGRDGRFVGRIA